MIWLKSLLVGIAAAIVTFVLAIVAIPIVMLTMAMWWADSGDGTGGIGAYASGVELTLLPLIAFALGFWWTMRRARRKRGPASA